MEWLAANTLASLLIPPGIVLVLAILGAILSRNRPGLGRSLIVFSFLALYFLSTPYFVDILVRQIEPASRDPARVPDGQAIVVLAGGTYYHAPEYGVEDTVSASTLERLRYAAHLYRALRKPILVSGGAPRGERVPEAELMQRSLQNDFGIETKWIEKRSRNTLENARRSREMLKSAGIDRVYLVTHAWHMARAQFAFESAGFAVIPAPTGFRTRFELSVLDFLPSARSMRHSSYFVHELLGLGWYHLRTAVGL